jgi:hypothetical protein
VTNHPVLGQLDIALRDHIPGEPIDFAGKWTKLSRRTYKSEAQLGTGAGPFVEVVDLQWRGTLTTTDPIGGIAFLLTAGNLYWAKAPKVSPALPVHVSLHAYAEYAPERATFTASMAGAYLPGIPVPVQSDLAHACSVEDGIVTTGRVSRLARAESAAFYVLLVPGGILEMGRKRLWRVRDEVASLLPPNLRELLTRRRTGSVLAEPP